MNVDDVSFLTEKEDKIDWAKYLMEGEDVDTGPFPDTPVSKREFWFCIMCACINPVHDFNLLPMKKSHVTDCQCWSSRAYRIILFRSGPKTRARRKRVSSPSAERILGSRWTKRRRKISSRTIRWCRSPGQVRGLELVQPLKQ